MPAAACATERPNRAGDALLDRAARRLGVERHATAGEERGFEPVQDQVGVGDGRLRPSLAVAGGSRVRARALRADPEQTALVQPTDAPASGPDGHDVQHRQGQRVAIDLAFADREGLPVADQGRVEGGPSHVHGDAVAVAVGLREGHRPRWGPPRGPKAASTAARSRATSGETTPPLDCMIKQHAAEAGSPAETTGQAVQVAAEHRADVGVQHGGGDTGIEPDGRQDLRGNGEVVPRAADLAHDLRRSSLVLRALAKEFMKQIATASTPSCSSSLGRLLDVLDTTSGSISRPPGVSRAARAPAAADGAAPAGGRWCSGCCTAPRESRGASPARRARPRW